MCDTYSKFVFVAILFSFLFPRNCLAQKELEQVIIERYKASNSYKGFLNSSCSINHKVEIAELNFDTLPVIKYDLTKSVFVPGKIVNKDYAVPNCTSSVESLNATFELTTMLKNFATIEKSEVETNKISTGFKIPITEGVDFSLSNDYTSVMTLKQQTSSETTNTFRETRTLNFDIPAATYKIVRFHSKTGILSVPFKAHFVVSGSFKVSYDLNCRVGIILQIMHPCSDEGHCEYIVPFKKVFKDEERTFLFNGYISSEQSSEIEILYDERKIDRAKDCIFKEEPKQTNISDETITSVWPDTKQSKVKAHIIELNKEEDGINKVKLKVE